MDARPDKTGKAGGAGQPRPQVVGKAVIHDSGERHVTGEAIFIDDMVEIAGTLHLAAGYADAACGKIVSLDLSAVSASPGVVAVLTHADIPGVNDCSPAMGDDPVLAEERIDFHGQAVFAVVAESRIAARKAARKAIIAVDREAPAITVEEGLARDDYVLPTYAFERGDADAAIKAARHALGGELRIGGQEHFYLEGQVAYAAPGENGEMYVHSSTQHPGEVQHTVAKVLGIADAAVVCECRRMGGGFGGKESQAAQWAALAALAAWHTGRPVKVRLDRDDDMVMTGKRHDFHVTWRAGHDNKGRLTGVAAQFNARCGCSADLSLGVNDRTLFHADNAYHYPAARLTSARVRTNTVSATAFRGFGGPQGMMMAERVMDAIAATSGLDPLDVRLTNLYGRGRDVTPYGMKVADNLAPELMKQLAETADYRKRRQEIATYNDKHPIIRRGLALTPVKFGIAFTLTHLNQAGALVHVYTDGSVQVNHGGTEMGQGLYVKVAQVVAEEFGIDLDQVRITATRTDKVPNTAPTAASSGCDLNAMAAKRAAGAIRARMAEVAMGHWNAKGKTVSFAGGKVRIARKSMTFAELARLCFLERVSLSATGFFATPKVVWDRDARKGRPFLYFAYGAACSEVAVDTMTGEMKVTRVDILHDVGTSINPAVDRGQIEGGFVQGMGWLTGEELVWDKDGRLTTHAPSTYKIPTAADVPEDFRVAIHDYDGNRESTIYRSKAVGEPPLMLALSVFSAIVDALSGLAPGKPPCLDAPATPEAIMRAVTRMNEAAA